MGFRILALVGLALSCITVNAGTIQGSEEPVRLEPVPAKYPAEELRAGREGWVVFNFMVDAEGQVYDPTVVAMSGSMRFVRSARVALLKTKYEPARVDGVPVDASSYARYTFALDRKPGASAEFGKDFRRFTKAFETDDRSTMEEVLERLRTRYLNHYESAHLNYIGALYARRYGTVEEEMLFLGQALGYQNYAPDGREYLPADYALAASKRLFVLLVQTGRYVEALNLYALMMKVHGEAAVEGFHQAYEQMIRLRDNDTAYPVNLILSDEGLAAIGLHKQGFFIAQGGDAVEEIKLRCTRKYAVFPHAQENQYQVPASWGQCHLQIRGQPDTRVRLIQF